MTALSSSAEFIAAGHDHCGPTVGLGLKTATGPPLGVTVESLRRCVTVRWSVAAKHRDAGSGASVRPLRRPDSDRVVAEDGQDEASSPADSEAAHWQARRRSECQ